MSTALKANPTIDQTAKAWTKGFAKAVRAAAGDNERLSKSEATKMEGPYADNAQNYFDRKHVQSVGTDTLIESANKYVRGKAKDVAGSNKKLSLAEIRNLPADLTGDILALRGVKAAKVSDGVIALKAAVDATDIAPINDYGKWLSVGEYPASKTKDEILTDITQWDWVEGSISEDDAFEKSSGVAAAHGFAVEMRSVGKDQSDNWDSDSQPEITAEGLEAKFTGVADGVEAAFFPLSQFKSVECFDHGISEDGDTGFSILVAQKKDGSWLTLTYTDYPF